ncbi:MAG: tetratricopeptide repeat protein [Myxococcales bacterium]|nr:tetratricopeptide repeat protein [Myxococcales bacterium]
MRSTPAWRSRVLSTLVAVAVAGAAMPSPAGAEPSAEDIERARELYENGVSLFEEGSYQGAVLAFQRAYELSEDNNLLYNIALAYDRLGEFERAIEYLDRYRALAPKSERAELERRKKSLVKRLEKQQETEAGAPEPDDDEPTDDAPTDDEPTDDEITPPPASPRDDRQFPPAAGALLGTAVVGLGLGIGFGVSSLRHSRSAEQGCTGAGDDLYCLSSSGDDLRRGRTHGIVADVSFAVGAAATVGMVIVLALAARKRKRSGDTALVPVPARAGGGLALARRF